MKPISVYFLPTAGREIGKSVPKNDIIEKMTKEQHIKYIPNRGKRTAIDRLEEFVNSPNVKAISITYIGRGIIVLYQEENITVLS